MKRISVISILAGALLCMTSCGSSSSISTESAAPASTDDIAVSENKSTSEFETSADIGDGEIDIDLTQLSSTMVYSQVYDMVNNGDDYLGKTVKAKGTFSYYQETDGREFFAVLVSDATACCSQGIEFVLDGEYSYPDDYPSIGTEITVVGKFNYYKEDYYTYCQLTDATMEVDTSLSWE